MLHSTRTITPPFFSHARFSPAKENFLVEVSGVRPACRKTQTFPRRLGHLVKSLKNCVGHARLVRRHISPYAPANRILLATDEIDQPSPSVYEVGQVRQYRNKSKICICAPPPSVPALPRVRALPCFTLYCRTQYCVHCA